MPDALHRKFAELEHRLLAGHEQIGRGVGVPFLLLLYPPSEELRVRRDVGSLVAKLRAEGRPVEVIDCNQVLLDYLHHTAELQRAIRAEKRNPGALKEFGIGEVLAEALAKRVITAQQQMSRPGVVVLTRMGALHPFLLPNIVQERLEDAETEDVTGDSEEDSQEMMGLDTCIPIPSESFLEELSQKLEIHPISIYWLLRTLRKHDGIVCLPELRHYVEDYFTIMILQLFAHRWPKQIEAEEPVLEWADPDGIIPLTDGTGQRTLLDRVRERIAVDFGEARVDAIEQEFRQIMDRSLIDWLARDFFPHHISQFKRRPIVWLLESGHAVDMPWETAAGRRGRWSARTRGPAFVCLVYYHKLTADTLTRIKTHYLRPVLQRQEFELAEERRRAVEGNVAARSAAERLAETVDELKTFERALDTVSAKGFLSRRLEQLLAREEPDRWARQTPRSPIPDKEAFSLQEQLYDPDLNDGVRVNIAPLQKSGLLAADVLAN
jgi:hypothetical protein